jgi:hypothetical protein
LVPYEIKWYDGTQLISNETASSLSVTHDFNVVEPASDISKSYYCYIYHNGRPDAPGKIAQFDVLFRRIPLPLAASQNAEGIILNVNESTDLKLTNIVGGYKPLTIVWEKEYPDARVVLVKTTTAFTGTEETLRISNIREFPINDGTIIYKATITDRKGYDISFNYVISCSGYYLSEPCMPTGTNVKIYDQNNQLITKPVQQLAVGDYIASVDPTQNNARVKVKVKNIYMRTITINNDLHLLPGNILLYSPALISNDLYLYKYVNSPVATYNGQTINVYQIETPNYLKYNILLGDYYLKSYGNHETSTSYYTPLDAYITIPTTKDVPVEEEGDVYYV